MADDLFHQFSPSKLREKIGALVLEQKFPLPERSKIFLAVVSMQGYDGWPGMVAAGELDKLVADGHVELNRGISGTRGVPAFFYARELLKGAMYPGALVAFGSGINLSTVSPHESPAVEGFPRISRTALKYGSEGESGVILRCALKPSARILDHQQIREIRRENRNRAREAQLTDFGSLTAALGFDGFLCDKLEAEQTETWYVVVNRTALIFQPIVLRRGAKPEPEPK